MPVSDMHVKILRGLLLDDPEAVGLAQERQQAGELNALVPLVEAAFGAAARRAFAPSWTMPGVIQLAARARVENAGSPVKFGALDAERELRRALGDKVPPPQSYEAAGAAMMCMLHVLIADLELDDAAVDDLLAEARPGADQTIAYAASRMSPMDVLAAALRAQLVGEEDEHLRLLGQVDPAVVSAAYPALVEVAFTQAVDRRFTSAADTDIVRFVSEVRLRGPELAKLLDPSLGEGLLRAAMNNENADGSSSGESMRTQLILLAGLIGDEHLDDEGVSHVIERARSWLISGSHEPS